MTDILTFDKLLYSQDRDDIPALLDEHLDDSWVTEAWDHSTSFPKVQELIAEWVEKQADAGTLGPQTKEMLKNYMVTWAIVANDHPKRLELLFHPEVDTNFNLSEYKKDPQNASIRAISFLNGMTELFQHRCLNAIEFIWEKNEQFPNARAMLYTRMPSSDHVPMVDGLLHDVWLRCPGTPAIDDALSFFMDEKRASKWGAQHPLHGMVLSMFRQGSIEGLDHCFAGNPPRIPWSVLSDVAKHPDLSGVSNSQLATFGWLWATNRDALDHSMWVDMFNRWFSKRSGVDFSRQAQQNNQLPKSNPASKEEKIIAMMEGIYPQLLDDAVEQSPSMLIKACEMASHLVVDWFLQRCPTEGIQKILDEKSRNALWDNMNISNHPRIVDHVLKQELEHHLPGAATGKSKKM